MEKPYGKYSLHLQLAAKLFQNLRYYLRFFFGLIAIFYYLMLVTSSIHPKDHDLTKIFHITALSMSFLKLSHELSQMLGKFCCRL